MAWYEDGANLAWPNVLMIARVQGWLRYSYRR